MTNDITTLNGALMQLGETLATNLTAKGVTASANDGLTTLANKINKISTEYLVYGNDVNSYTSGTGLTKSFNANYECVLENTATATRYYNVLFDGFTATSLATARCFTSGDYVFEFDLVDYTGVGSVQLYGTSTSSRTFAQLGTGHIKVILENNIPKFYNGTTLIYTGSSLTLTSGLAFRIGVNAGTTVTFKNIKIREL